MENIRKSIKKLKTDLKGSDSLREVELIEADLDKLTSKKGCKKLLEGAKLDSIVEKIEYEEELAALQVELIKLQNWVYENNKRVMIVFEGRDAAGKGGAIKRFTQYLNPRKFRVAALPKPSEIEMGQFYFQRYFQHLPNPGEIVFFDRSWYNRAIVEPAYGFCTKKQYEKFIREVPEIEHALTDDGIILIKLWFSITKKNQQKRFEERMTNPLKHWKLSPVDKKAQEMWDRITFYKEEMFSRTHTAFAPWIIVDSNDKKLARIESIKYVLSLFDYEKKEDASVNLHHDPDVVERYHKRSHGRNKT